MICICNSNRYRENNRYNIESFNWIFINHVFKWNYVAAVASIILPLFGHVQANLIL